MLRITQSNSAAGTSKYFDEGFAKSDYYSQEDSKTIGRWGGKAADKLGLSGDIEKQDFDDLANNINPDTKDKLNPRNKDNRKVGYDLTFSAPKSASVLYAVNNDGRIKSAFESSVRETMEELEENMMTQKGQGKEKRHERTGNMVWGEFTHNTTRPVNGEPDCHLHTHCFAFNTTWNEDKKRFQAGEFGNIKGNAPYYETAFNSRFAKKMQELGYEVERDKKSWKVKGMDKETTDKFSNRTKQIEAEAAKRGITDAKTKSELGARTRSSKRSGESYEELRNIWNKRLSREERAKIKGLQRGTSIGADIDPQLQNKRTMDTALNHMFERKSAVSEKSLLADAMRRGYGVVTPESAKHELDKRNTIKSDFKNNTFLTVKSALNEEKNLIKNVREGRGKFPALNKDYKPQTSFLNKGQKDAINHVLSSNDQVMMIEGDAGTGKTTLMKDVKDGLNKRGKRLYGFAPSADASRGVMRQEGFKNANTIAKFLADKELQNQTYGQVIWIDEAGMVGNKTMNNVLKVAKQQDARVLLTGDTKQHTSVEAGDAMRIIKQRGGIKVARVNEIQRQRNAKDYKDAVKLISSNRVGEGFDKLDRMGNVHEISDREERQNKIASDYIKSKKAKRSAIVVAPTHKEGKEVTKAIRAGLRKEQMLSPDERQFQRYQNLNLTKAEKQDAQNYKYGDGQIIEFTQNAKGFKAGSRHLVSDVKGGEVYVPLDYEGNYQKLNIKNNADRFNVYQEKKIGLSAGDYIRMTKGGKTMEGKRLNNGNIYKVMGFDHDGNIKLNNNSTLHKNFAHFNHGYVMTSHASQGKTVDDVFIAQGSDSFPASNKKQFYVSVSRGRKGANIYTDNKDELKDNIENGGDRMTATEVAEQKQKKEEKQKKKQEKMKKKAIAKRKEKERMAENFMPEREKKFLKRYKDRHG